MNPLKIFWCCALVKYLSFLITWNRIKPKRKKVQAIMAIPKQVRAFIRMVNYYKNTWKHRAHLLAPLTELTEKRTEFQWTKWKQDAFYQIKWIFADETMLVYPNFPPPFMIYMDASDYQMAHHTEQHADCILQQETKCSTMQVHNAGQASA